ncbi:MAG: cell division protein FtsZ [Eubacteriaceae bacterium]|nr:cell division protein FtsZ [Eubacteriaceae bacterium]
MTYELVSNKPVGTANIKVVGVGGAGNNAVNRMIESGLQGVSFFVVNTDSQALNLSQAENKLQIGVQTTGGLGAGANPEIGGKSAEENIEDIQQMLEGADLVFITAGMGGGTGTGASHVIARVARDLGLLVVGVVTRPFNFEGKVRKINADLGIQLIREYVDALVVIPNDRLLQMANQTTTFNEALKMADEVLLMGVKGITDLIATPALINLDFADVKTIISNAGLAHMGMGIGSGDEKAVSAATIAIQSPLLETNIDGATNLLINITGGEQLTLFEIEKIAEIVRQEAHLEANIIFGACIDPTLENEIKVTVLATGFSPAGTKQAKGASLEEFDRATDRRQPNHRVDQPTKRQNPNPWPSFLDDFS